MSFRITGLSPEPFRHLFGLSAEELAGHGAKRYVADATSAYPDRIEVRDAEPGESVLLVNYTHQPADTPYQAKFAIFVRENAEAVFDAVDEVPEAMRRRTIALRGFDAEHMQVKAELADGKALTGPIALLFADPRIAYIQAHYAAPGCYAARIDRA
jgi:Protein of unknown function (DUF1203)